MRDIFRKLASALHPDRETDAAERERKNNLMQRANMAYAANDLLGLLELQFEIAQIDEASLSSQGDARIKQYNTVLTKQINEVRREIAELENHFAYEMHVTSGGRVTPAAIESALSAEVKGMKLKLAGIHRDLASFKNLKQLKAFLKAYGKMAEHDYYDGSYYTARHSSSPNFRAT